MRSIILLIILTISSFAYCNDEISHKLENIVWKLDEDNDYEKISKQVIKELIQFEINKDNTLDNCIRYYYLSFCYFSLDPVILDNVSSNLKITFKYMQNMSIKDKKEIALIIENSYHLYNRIVDYNLFSYDDIEHILDQFINIFEYKVKIAENLKSAKLAVIFRNEINDFKINILNNKHNEKINQLLQHLNVLFIKFAPTLEINTKKN